MSIITHCVCVCVCVCVWGHCRVLLHMDCSPPGFSVHGVSQTKILEWVDISFSRESSQPRDQTHISFLAGGFFNTEPPGKPYTIQLHILGIKHFYYSLLLFTVALWVKVTHLCLTLCNPVAYTVHGILQARILKWVDFPFPRGSSQPRDQTQVSHITGGFFTSWATREAQQL